MHREPHVFAKRGCGGFSTVKLLVWVAIVATVYSGYKVFSVYANESLAERAVETALGQIDHDSTDAQIRRAIAKRANTSSLTLDEEQIQIEREQRHGERIVHVALEYPIPVSFLGSEITFNGSVRASRTIKVNEAALARRAEREQERREESKRLQEIAAERDRKLMAAMKECEEKWGKESCEKFEIPGADPDEIVKLY